jgi:hypothetical protein
MREHGCSVGLSGHDGWNGMAIYTASERREVGFGTFSLPEEQAV